KLVAVTQSTQRGLYKTYDGTTSMNPNDLSLEISGTVAGDELSVLAAADFESKNVGTNIPVDIHSIQLDGKDKDNYQLTSQHTTAVGTIEPYVLTLTFSQDQPISKIYDGTTKAAISKEHLVLPTLFGEDEVSLEVPAFASYDSKNAGTGKQITVEGISLSGKDAGNY
ncbi:YDG domain-containing protein, partial [Flavihumibacter sediminis]|nr:YDG domain-containing protein [Flavihumibacter sediminis]